MPKVNKYVISCPKFLNAAKTKSTADQFWHRRHPNKSKRKDYEDKERSRTLPLPPRRTTCQPLVRNSSFPNFVRIQCDQIGRFIGPWASFKNLCQQLICPNLPHS